MGEEDVVMRFHGHRSGFVVAVAAVLVLAACGDDDDGAGGEVTGAPTTSSAPGTTGTTGTGTTGTGTTGTTGTGTATSGTATATTGEAPAATGGTVVVGRTGDIDNLDPHLATAFQTIDALELVYDSLTELDADLNVQPALATDWSYNADGTELTMNLREGVTFHDGSPFTSEDVVASLERILDEATGAVVRSNLLSIESVTAPDDLTVVMTLSVPDATLPAALSDLNTAILPSEAIEAGTVATEPNGTGPFSFVEWEQGQQLELASFADYWGDGPFIDGVTIRVIPEEQAMLSALQAGEVQLGVVGNPAVIEQVSDPLVLERSTAMGYFPFFLNSSRPPLDVKEVRQAISCAIDRQELIDTALLGEGVPTGPFVEGIFKTEPFDGLPCDGPDKDMARQLLADGGQPDGFSMETIIITGENESGINIAQNLQAQLAEIGVDLELQPLETNIYVDRWLEADFDSALSENGSGPDPHHTYAKYFTSTGNFQNVAGLNTPELDDLFAEGQATTDPEARVPIYHQISQILLDESPWVWLYQGYRFQVRVPELEGFVPHPTGSLKSLRQVTLGSD
jgi:peptide/nickel transport system substrate-binding protein